MNEVPFISTMIVTRNEEKYIREALFSLIYQDYPKDKYEIIVIDGMSTDKTIDIVKEIFENNKNIKSKLLVNEKKILASGWNIGIKESLGDYVVRIDAHAKVENNFLSKSINAIMNIDAVCVGGKLNTKSIKGENPIFAKVLSSPFGVGNSSFRVSNVPGYADTAVYGLYKKEAIEKAGYFNEKYERNQDIELHSRIKKNGGKFYFDPEIKVDYYSRNSTKKLIKQSFGNGKWNMILLKKDFKSLSIRHLVPFLFLVFLVFSIIMGFVSYFFWIIMAFVLALYFILGFIFSLKATKEIKEIIVMPILFFLLHISYGAGYFCGLFKNINK